MKNTLPIIYKRYQGFTLIELMIAISIVAVLATIGFNSFSQSQVRARDAKRKQDLRAIAQGLELYYQRNNRFPCTDSDGWIYSNGTDWLKDKVDTTKCPTSTNASIAPVFVNRLPKDPSDSRNYGYYNGAASTAVLGNCTDNSTYVLTAVLENPKDPETVTNDGTRACGVLLKDATGIDPNTFAISSE